MGPRLAAYGHAQKTPEVRTREPTKSISAETTFGKDLSALDDLRAHLDRLASRVASRAQRSRKQGWVITLKLKTEDFQTFTRRQKLPQPTNEAHTLQQHGQRLLRSELGKGPFRLIGLGLSDFSQTNETEPPALLTDPLSTAPRAGQN